jgi:hypothetical protein
MTQARTLALLVVAAHWMVAIWHLFVAAQVLPAPNNHVSSLAIILITSAHLVVSILLWKMSDKVVLAGGDWTVIFNVSVSILLALEIVGCSLGTMVLGGRRRNNNSTPGLNSKFGKQSRKLFSGQVEYVAADELAG